MARSSSPSLAAIVLMSVLVLLHSACCSAQTAMQNMTITPIEAFVRYTGLLPANQYVYFSFQPHSTNQPVDFHLTVTQGVALLLLATNASKPYPYYNPFDFNNRNLAVNQTSYLGGAFEGRPNFNFRLDTTDSRSCAARRIPTANCIYYIAALAYTVDARYVVMIGQPGDIAPIDLFPVYGTVAPGQCAQHVYHNELLNSDTTLVVSAVVTQGDVDIYVAGSPGANSSNYIKSSTNSGDDLVSFSPAVDVYYYVGICNRVSTPSNFIVRARTYSREAGFVYIFFIDMDDVTPDAIIGGGWSYYSITLQQAYPSITISVNARIGDPDLYILKGLYSQTGLPNATLPSGSTWHQDSPGTDGLTIYEPGVGPLTIGIYAWASADRPDWGGDASYTLSVTAEGRSNALINGNAVSMDSLREGHFMYYALTVTNVQNNSQLVISLGTRKGNPDLYVSDRLVFPNITAGRYNFSSSDSGNTDNLVITRSSPYAGALHNGTYYIAVYAKPGGGLAGYSLTAVMGARLVLADGVPSNGQVASGGTFVYEAFYARGTAFTVTVRETSGLSNDPLYVYVSERDSIVAGNASTYTWAGTTSDTVQQVEVSGAECASDSDLCRYFIMVYKAAGATDYQHTYNIIVQTGSSLVPLVVGEPKYGEVAAGESAFFRFSLACADNDVTLLLTADSGNPDLYLNMGPEPPTRQSAVWRSPNAGLANDVITLSRSDAYFRTRSMIGQYYVSVFGAAQVSSAYSLLLSVQSSCVSNVTYNTLRNGQPQWYYIAQAWQYAYFEFTVAPQQWPTTVVFAVSPTDGSDPDMFITKDGSTPTNTTADWRATGSEGQDDIVAISPTSTDPTPCIPLESSCTYHVAVFAWGRPSAFSISASTDRALLGLQMDYAREGYAARGEWAQYVVQVTNDTQPLVVIVTPSFGNPDLYVEYGEAPSFDSLTSKTFGVDVVTIAEPQTGRWHIGVYGAGNTDATFSIVASQRGIALRNGRPQDDVLNLGERRYYFYEFSEPAPGRRPFRLQLDAISFQPQLDVYIRREFNPSERFNQGSALSSRGDALSFNVNFTNPLWNRTTTWRVLVISRSSSAAYSITAMQGAPPIYLSDGRPADVGEAVPAGEYRYFRLVVTSREFDVDVIVSAQYGRVALFLSSTEALPGNDTSYNHYLLMPANATSLTLRIPRAQLLVPDYVYAGVYSVGPGEARFTVTMTTGVVVMNAGEAQVASCRADALTNAYVVYLPFNASYIDDVTLSASPTSFLDANYSRNLYLYVSTNTSSGRAGPANNDWSFLLLNWETPFTISRNDPKLQACVQRDACELKIRVGCPSFSQPVDYQFSVKVGAVVTPLQDGTGLLLSQAGLMAQQDRYYTLPAPSVLDLTVRLEPCVGNALLFVNYLRAGIPTASASDASSTNTRAAQQVVISQPVTAPGNRLTVTVRGASIAPAEYRLYAWQGATFDYLSPTTNNSDTRIWVASPESATDMTIKIWFMAARAPQAVVDGYVGQPEGATGMVRYSVFWQREPISAVMYTACGLNRINLAGQWVATQLRGANLTVPFRVPSDVSRYSVQVLAQYVWRTGSGTRVVDVPATEGYLVYNYVVGVRPGSMSPGSPTGQNDWGDDSSSSSGRGPIHPADLVNGPSAVTVDVIIIAFAIGVPVVVLVCAGLLFLHHKNRLVRENGGIDLAPINQYDNTSSEQYDTRSGGRGDNSSRRGGQQDRYMEDDSSSGGGYVPPGAQQPVHQSGPSAAQQYAQYGGYESQTGGGDFGGGGSGGGGGGGDGGGGHVAGGGDSWHNSNAHNPYDAQSSHESEHVSGRGFYEL